MYRFLVPPEAELSVDLVRREGAPVEIRLVGNREGMLGLANILLWLDANSSERELLSVTALEFVRNPRAVHLTVRAGVEASPNRELAGRVMRLDEDAAFEWVLTEEELRNSALVIHRLACSPGHEYDLFPYDDELVGDTRLHFRLATLDDDSNLPAD